MFYSYEQLVGRNAKFALVWKMATAANQKRKSIPKAAILDMSVPDLCTQLMEMVPSTTSLGELRSKFSLYLLAQLLYGVTLVFERQTSYLEIDARAAQASVEQLYLNAPLQTPKRKGKGREDERGTKKARLDKDAVVGLADLPPVDLTTLDAVGVALYNQVTLQDEIPRGAPEPLLEDLAPLTREDLNDDWSRDWEAVHSRQSNNGSNEAAKITEIEEVNIMQKEPSMLEELPPLEPLQENTPIDLSNNDHTIQSARAPLREPTPLNEDNKMSVFDNIQLDRTVAFETGLKRRGPRALRMRDDVTMLSMSTIKENLTNFSSTLRSRNEILVSSQLNKTKDLEDMDKPYPTWRRRPINKVLRRLFKTKEIRKITYDEAGAIDPNAPQPRGRESQLWRYEGSSENMASRQEIYHFPPLDDDLRPMGIAFLHPTPEKNKQPDSLLEEDFQMPPLPPMAELEEMDPFGQTTAQSALEEARRSMGMHKSAASDGRRDTLHDDDFPIRGGMGRALLNEELAIESPVEVVTSKIVIEKSVLKALRNAPGVSFAKLFPPSSNSRKRAARAFTVVLEMLKAEKILAVQEETYGDILLQQANSQAPA